MKKALSILLISTAICGLSACSSMKHHGNEASVADVNGVNGAQTAGVGENGNFNGANSEDAINKKVFLFEFDRSDIQEDDKAALNVHADNLIAHPTAKILLEGHTDPRGSREYNVALGEHRANSVSDFLKAKGVNPEQIRVISYGAERLSTPGHTEEDYQQDRRAVLVYLQQ
jgi:peptidoglycan-associated lipoprotein